MTRTPSEPAGLSDFIPERDGHALILGASAGNEAVGWCFANAPGADIVVLADLPASLTDGDAPIVRARIQQRFLRQRAGGDEPDDGAVDQRL